jgi:hypothetical protein
MKRIPKTIEDCKAWPLDVAALHLEQKERYNGLHKRIAKYVHEVMPVDEEAIASSVRINQPLALCAGISSQ